MERNINSREVYDRFMTTIYGRTESCEDAPHFWKSDDYIIVSIPDDVEDPDDYMHLMHLEVFLGNGCEKKNYQQP